LNSGEEGKKSSNSKIGSSSRGPLGTASNDDGPKKEIGQSEQADEPSWHLYEEVFETGVVYPELRCANVGRCASITVPTNVSTRHA
jgi:hypothetical protein